MGELEEKLEEELGKTVEKLENMKDKTNDIVIRMLLEGVDDARLDKKRLFNVCIAEFCIVTLLIIGLVGGLLFQNVYFTEKFNKQSIMFAEKLEIQQKEFMKFLLESDIGVVTTEQTIGSGNTNPTQSNTINK